MGVTLQSGEFDEPARRGVAAQERRPLPAMVRAQRFTEVFVSPRFVVGMDPGRALQLSKKRCWVQNLWVMRENIRKMPYAMGHGH